MRFTTPVGEEWIEDELGLLDNGGDVGGDIQVSDAFERQFARQRASETLFEVVTFYVYVAREADGEPWIQVSAWYSTCRDLEDVGGSEVDTAIRYWDGLGQGEATAEQARAVCASLGFEDVAELLSQVSA
jgi:hypothetical protein